MSIFQQLWLVICLLVPASPHKPPDVAPASSPTSTPKSPPHFFTCICAKTFSGSHFREWQTRRSNHFSQDASDEPLGELGRTSRYRRVRDSLTAGYGLTEDQGFRALLQRKIDEMGYRYRVENHGMSGDTSAGGVSRIDWALEEGPVKLLILELGGNDGLRGLPVADMKKNLAEIIERTQARGVTVILAGMEAPPNMGEEYTSEFRQVYRDLAKKYKLTLIPFLLEGVAGNREMNQPDGIHPNAAGEKVMTENVWRELEPLLLKN